MWAIVRYIDVVTSVLTVVAVILMLLLEAAQDGSKALLVVRSQGLYSKRNNRCRKLINKKKPSEKGKTGNPADSNTYYVSISAAT